MSKILDKLLEIGWLAIFFLSPIFFCPWVHGTWQIGEMFLFQILTEIIFFAWLIKIIFQPKADPPRAETYKERWQKFKFIFPAIIFIVILGLATIFSQSHYQSFFGYYQRKMGYLMWLHFFAFFLVLFSNLKSKEQIQRIFYVICGTTAVVAIYGFMQIFGWEIFPWSEQAYFSYRIFSTLGQPNFLASWLLFAIPIVVWVLLKSKDFKRRIILRPLIFCLFLLVLFNLVLTQSRGGWFGFLAAFFFFIIIFCCLKKQKQTVILFSVLCSLLIVVGFYFNSHPLTIKENDPALVARAKTLTQLSASGKLRLMWWKNSLDLIKQKPILGYGPETQVFNFVRYYEPEFGALEAINTYPDRAHNDILDTLLISGILGLTSYLFLIGSVFWFGLKSIFPSTPARGEARQGRQVPPPEARLAKGGKYPSTQVQILALLAGLIGYLVSLQFSFHIIPTAIYFWGYLAIILKIFNYSN